ncbi:SDR family NAD(P)-dependent oxidoreductase [Devosia sp. J2-20]|jgi:NAD(P)-dependent dehydrogenase (short-subunit alcohol dehydrogenase family)|uniref:SDR family oxidoreductase n=1 Tax=Devosia TaxID=46913 RepID=UPI0022AFA218|nr:MULTISPECIES: SDR family NAD(P)-dependent oxidoreductase [Devosia]MCZ4346976.1 SDR family NAD(P)-dependent oxidoreductase [Devosia neptuniae]WDR00692.1 SDR family NAD(P)-dependent oxidoreductase [Devosia sp. J2-20]|tara:strand:+ start:12940 stop:13719 length:780 start_codon:yes stop_codon:yes gene_type:complete
MQFSDKVALVTGAGSGIGKATALRLAKGGARVAVLSRTDEEINATRDEIVEAGGQAMAVSADISDPDGMRAAVDRIMGDWGQIDIVVANAGINGVWAPIDELMPDEWDKTTTTNLGGTYLTLHLTVPHLKRAGGAIIIVSSINGNRTFTSAGATAYAATKAAQVAMAQQLALELGPHKIRVNAVCPGAIDTQIDDNTDKRNVAAAEIPVEFPEGDIPLTGGEPGKSGDVAETIAFLASDAARHITGVPVYVDGGQSLLR